MKFYAVANGRKTGVFDNWKECEESVKLYPGAKFKKFNNYEEAAKFIEPDNKLDEIQKLMQTPEELAAFISIKKEIEESNLDLTEDQIIEMIKAFTSKMVDYEKRLGEALEYAKKRWFYGFIVLGSHGEIVDINIEYLMEWYDQFNR